MLAKPWKILLKQIKNLKHMYRIFRKSWNPPRDSSLSFKFNFIKIYITRRIKISSFNFYRVESIHTVSPLLINNYWFMRRCLENSFQIHYNTFYCENRHKQSYFYIFSNIFIYFRFCFQTIELLIGRKIIHSLLIILLKYIICSKKYKLSFTDTPSSKGWIN